jgi:hypothetical protein
LLQMEAFCSTQLHGYPSLGSASPVVYSKSLSQSPFPPSLFHFPLFVNFPRWGTLLTS